jgi:hypothetical protein
MARSTSLPSASASVHQWSARVSFTLWPPAARAAAMRLSLVARHVDVDVDAVALWTWHVHLLECEGRPAAMRIEHVFVADLLVAEHRARMAAIRGTGGAGRTAGGAEAAAGRMARAGQPASTTSPWFPARAAARSSSGGMTRRKPVRAAMVDWKHE